MPEQPKPERSVPPVGKASAQSSSASPDFVTLPLREAYAGMVAYLTPLGPWTITAADHGDPTKQLAIPPDAGDECYRVMSQSITQSGGTTVVHFTAEDHYSPPLSPYMPRVLGMAGDAAKDVIQAVLDSVGSNASIDIDVVSGTPAGVHSTDPSPPNPNPHKIEDAVVVVVYNPT